MRKPLFLLVLLLCTACTATGPHSLRSDGEASGVPAVPLLTPEPDQTWMLRHVVRLRIPGRDLDNTFEGIMRLNRRTRTMRLVALGGFGLKLFDLTVTPEETVTHFLHPSLTHIPGLTDRIAFCVRCIRFGPHPGPAEGLPGPGELTLAHDRNSGISKEHEFTSAGLTLSRGTDPENRWRIDYIPPATDPEPGRQIRFTDGKNRYTLLIRLVSARTIQ